MADRDRLLELAFEIGERLCAEALPDGDGCGWEGLKPAALNGGFAHRRQRLGPDLYTGTAGNALVLAVLSRLAGEESLAAAAPLRATALGAARGALSRASEVEPAIRMSFYAGWIGIAFAALAAGQLLEDRATARDGRALLRRAARLDPRERPTDQFIGCASAVMPLLALYRHDGAEWALAAAERIGAGLVAASRERDGGRSWEPSGPMSHLHQDALAGFAHGVSGIAAALLELGVALGDDRLCSLAEEGFAYERRWYLPERENWLDVRYMPGPDGDINDGRTCQIQWCHGAAGIGLARLRAYELLGTEIYREEATAAIHTIIGDLARWPHNWQPGFSLCHGVPGNCELLLEGGRVLDDGRCTSAALAAMDAGIGRFAVPGAHWPGALGPEQIPALMTGVGGVAWILLRLYAPERVPSLLLPTSLEWALAPRVLAGR